MSPATQPAKTSIHAPWTKKVLIPLWVVQFGFSVVELGWSLGMLIHAVHSGRDSGISNFGKITEAVLLPLHLILCVMLIATFILFARFKLTTMRFLVVSSAAVVIGIASTALAFAGGANGDVGEGGDTMGGIWCAIHLLASLALTAYVLVVRAAVRKGMTAEMNAFPRDDTTRLAVGRDSV